jgi:hypothetical protein
MCKGRRAASCRSGSSREIISSVEASRDASIFLPVEGEVDAPGPGFRCDDREVEIEMRLFPNKYCVFWRKRLWLQTSHSRERYREIEKRENEIPMCGLVQDTEVSEARESDTSLSFRNSSPFRVALLVSLLWAL